MSLIKTSKRVFAIAFLAIELGFNSFVIEDTLAEPVSNTQEKLEFNSVSEKSLGFAFGMKANKTSYWS